MSYLVFSETTSEEETFFFLKNNQLFFTYNNGVDIDPKFSSKVEGSLFLNEKNQFILQIKPFKKRWGNTDALREIILIRDVTCIEYEFYKQNLKEPLEIDPEEVKKLNMALGFNKNWDQEFNQLPHSFKIEVTQKNKNNLVLITLPFVLCNL